MENKYKVEVQRSRLRQIDRNKFDRMMEVGRKKDAELWSRTFVYDAILLTEKLIYIRDSRNKVEEENKKLLQEKKELEIYNTNLLALCSKSLATL